MMPPESRQDRWKRLKQELEAYSAAETARWGGIDERLLARYIADQCTAEERQQVEDAAIDYPAVKDALKIVVESLVNPLATSEGMQPGFDQAASQRIQAPNGENTQAPQSAKRFSSGNSRRTRSSRRRQELTMDLLNTVKASVKLTASVAVSVSLIALGLSAISMFETARQTSQLVSLLQSHSSLFEREQNGSHGLELHSGNLHRPSDWSEIWSSNVLASDADDENLRRLRLACPTPLQRAIDELKESNFTATEIIAYLKIVFRKNR